MENGKEPINPHLVHTHSGEVQEYSKGLTKLEYFAGLAMQGVLAEGITSSSMVAPLAIGYAKSLLKELEKIKSK